jgi:UrcA family protein
MSAKFGSAKAVFAALAFCALAPAAFAENKPQELSFAVSYADLNMSAPAGGRTLLGRIEKAARKACNAAIPNSPLLARKEIECRNDAVASAVGGLRLPTLTHAWNGKYPMTIVLAVR